ncbi:MAG: hypothetical protein DI616_16035 [Paracoccus denitrificans]|uniref:Uncharacterized protein n=1 Tax=Paracoccus denitrificans TaxID=266 RepID=A0A533I4D2_PARDE|nr:MAG: hypothetical protein DI616_16035 [Paracoccus denitrificans]
MEIRISEKEITAGVVTYLNSRGFNLDPATVKIDYTVGRKPAGVTAVLIEEEVQAEPVTGVAVGTSHVPAAQVLTGQANTAGATLVEGEAAGKAPVADLSPEDAPVSPSDPEPELQDAQDPSLNPAADAQGDAPAAQPEGKSLFA